MGLHRMPDVLIRTDEVMTRADLIELLDWIEAEDEDGTLGDLRETHDGEWRREGESYRFYELEGYYNKANEQWPYCPSDSVEVEPGVFVGPLSFPIK